MSSCIVVAIRVAATPQRAFDVFTREIAAWWQPNPLFRFCAPTAGTLSLEPWVGGRFVETGPQGSIFEIGRVLEWQPGERLAFTWRQSTFTADQSTDVSVRFDAIGDETRVTVEHRGWDAVPAEHAARHGFPDHAFLQRHGEWWQSLLQALQRRVG